MMEQEHMLVVVSQTIRPPAFANVFGPFSATDAARAKCEELAKQFVHNGYNAADDYWWGRGGDAELVEPQRFYICALRGEGDA